MIVLSAGETFYPNEEKFFQSQIMSSCIRKRDEQQLGMNNFKVGIVQKSKLTNYTISVLLVAE